VSLGEGGLSREEQRVGRLEVGWEGRGGMVWVGRVGSIIHFILH